MPRPWIETVQPWPDLNSKRLYPCLVSHVEKHRRPDRIVACITHIEEPNKGQIHRIELPLPIRPSGLTNQFVAACGFDASIANNVAPNDTEGKELLVRFTRTDAGFQPFSFELLPREQHDGQPSV